MELLYSRATPGPEFVSLSILLRSDISGGETAPISCHLGGGGGEPLLLSGPLSTISHSSCVEALTELHFYINSILKAAASSKSATNNNKTSSNNNATTKDTTIGRFLQEDESFLFGNNRSANTNTNTNTKIVTQIFRPNKCHGIAMQYHLIRDRKQLSSFVPLILYSSKLYSSKINNNNNAAAKGFEMKEVTGVVFCVGMGGAPSAAFGVGTSCLTYSLSHRMKQCIGILCSTTTTASANNTNNTNKNNIRRSMMGGATATTSSSSSSTVLDLASARSLLTTLLLTDDEDRIVNSVVNGEQRIDIFQEDQFTKRMSTISSKRRSNQQDNNNAFATEGGCDDENPLQANSADQARIIVERMAVLSVCDSDSMLRKYERRATRDAATSGKSGKKRLRKLARDADLDGFDFRGEKRSSSISNLDRNTNGNIGGGGDDLSLSARSSHTNTSNLTLKGPKKDTASRTSNRSRQQQSILASNSKDSSATRSNRRKSVDHSVASSAGGRPRNNIVGRRSTSIGHAIGDGSGHNNQNHPTHNSSSTQSVESSDGGASLVSSVRTPQGSIGSRTHQIQGRQHFDPFSGGRELSTDTSTTASETTFGQEMLADVAANGNGGAPAKVLVNIALNEDLTCFYKLSKLSSCSVEGVVQVQVRSNVDQGVPFSLLIRDPSKHIQSIQENKKYADSMVVDTLASNHHRGMKSDYMFTVSVPKADDYFPVMRYKCGNELKPVPIVSSVPYLHFFVGLISLNFVVRFLL